MNEKLQEYEDYVDTLAKKRSDDLIANGMADHAAILIAKLLRFASKEVRVFSTRLNSGIYDQKNVLQGLKEALRNPDLKIKILLQNIDGINTDFLEICKLHPDQCEIKLASTQESKDKKEHFITMDNVGYRYCPVREVPTAVASFSRPQTAKKLNYLFDTMFDGAKLI